MTSEIRGAGEYPVLPLKNVVVFPRTVVNLTVGRSKSLAAVEEAVNRGIRLVVATQRNGEADDPTPDELYTIGTLVEILKMNRQNDGTAQVVVEGLRRINLQRVTTAQGFLRARTMDLAEQFDGHNPALLRHVAEQFDSYAKLNRNIPAEAVDAVNKVETAGRIADLLAAHLPIDTAAKQGVLEILSHSQRLEKIAMVLANEIELQELDQEIRGRVRQQMDRNQREYYLKEQLKAIHEELGNDSQTEIQDLLQKIAEKGLPEAVAAKMVREVHRLERMASSSPEANVVRTYLDLVLSLPWTERSDDQLDVDAAQRVLDEDHYGLEKVKERIVEFLAVRQLIRRTGRTDHKGPILCLVGPPGVGKTSLGRSVARATNRKFVRLSLGGVRDEAEIRGHRRTYVGALPGRIIQAMRTAGVVNPVLLLDEVDKMTSDLRGDPGAALLEVLDPEQNHAFVDHYLEVPYDLSQVLFITTANVAWNIPRPLRDRMELIEINGYTEDEKVNIARQFLAPKQITEHGLAPSQLQISDKTIHAILRGYTREAGVRGLERAIAGVCRKVAIKAVKDPAVRVRVTPGNLDDYLGPVRYLRADHRAEHQIGVATGLSYTENGGEVLPVEVATMPGKGGLTITGRLGDVMQESARAALSYARSRADQLHIDRDFQEKTDLHIHVPEGATPKDGPSAGITMASALISALTRRPIRNDVAMTGEITLRGRVLPIGGLKEKSIAAHRAGIRRVIAPLDNQRDLAEIPKRVRDDVSFVWVDTMDEVLREVLVDEPLNVPAAPMPTTSPKRPLADSQPPVEPTIEPVISTEPS